MDHLPYPTQKKIISRPKENNEATDSHLRDDLFHLCSHYHVSLTRSKRKMEAVEYPRGQRKEVKRIRIGILIDRMMDRMT